MHDMQVIGVSCYYGVVRLHNLLALLVQDRAHGPYGRGLNLTPNWYKGPWGVRGVHGDVTFENMLRCLGRGFRRVALSHSIPVIVIIF